MCDYSLMGIPNRLAIEGEELMVHRFRTGSIGLTTPFSRSKGFWRALKELLHPPVVPAVCIPPGSRLRLLDVDSDSQRALGLGAAEEVVFTQITASANSYRDAFRFENGRQVLLQRLHPGLHVRVLSLSCSEEELPAIPEVSQTAPSAS